MTGLPEGPSLLMATLKMLFGLSIVLGLLFGLSKLSRKYLARFASGATPGRSVSVVEARSIGPKIQVVVVEAYGARYLLGVTPGQVSVIDKVEIAHPAPGSAT